MFAKSSKQFHCRKIREIIQMFKKNSNLSRACTFVLHIFSRKLLRKFKFRKNNYFREICAKTKISRKSAKILCHSITMKSSILVLYIIRGLKTL
jgi:hypothetical protein